MDLLKLAAWNGDVKTLRALLQQGKYPVDYIFFSKTLLHYACEQGQLEVVKVLVSEFKANLTITDYKGCTPPLCACEKGYLDVVKELASNFDADLSIRDVAGRSALMLAARGGHLDVVIALVQDYHCSVTDSDMNGWRALHHACAGGNVAVMRTLIHNYKANASLQNKKGISPLQVAINYRNFDVVFCLIREFGCDPNVANKQGETPLHYACGSGNLELVHALVYDHKASVNVQNDSQQTPLEVAVFYQHYDVACLICDRFDPNVAIKQGETLQYACKKENSKVLNALIRDKAIVNTHNNLKQGLLKLSIFYQQYEAVFYLIRELNCNPNVVDQHGQTPLHYACRKGDSDLVRALVQDHNANVIACDKLMKTPLHVAVEEGKYEAALVLDGCEPNIGDRKGQTPLHYACRKGDTRLVHALVQNYKADLNACDKLMKTPLHVAVEEGKYEAALALDGCEPNIGDRKGQTPLHYACGKGDTRLVHALVQIYKADLNACDKLMKTPLHVAVEKGKHETAQALIGCDPNRKDLEAQTPLHCACRSGDIKLVRALVCHHKADVNACNKSKQTPIEVAVCHQHYDVAFFLICEFGCDPNVADQQGQTPLHYACTNGDLDLVNALVQDHNADLNACDKLMKTPLHVAAEEGKHETAQALIGCDPNRKDLKAQTPLHYACRSGDIKLVRTLVYHHKADVNACNTSKQTPLEVAVCHQHYDVAFCMIREFGCNPNVADQQGQTPLHYACTNGDLDLVDALVQDHKASITRKDCNGCTPLHCACEKGKLDIVKVLVSKFEADLSIQDDLGCTPLHVAIDRGHNEVVLALCKHCSDPNVANEEGQTPLFLAFQRGDINLLHHLIRRCRGKVNVRNKQGDTLLHVAAYAGQYELVLALINEYEYDPTAVGDLGRTPLHMASRAGHYKTVQALLRYTTPLVADKQGNTPLHLASRWNHKLSVESLLDMNAPVLIRNNFGKTALEVAVGESKSVLEKYIRTNVQHILSDYENMSEYARNKYSGPHYITRIFVIGNPGAGKSSFIESLKRESFFQSFSKVTESSVPLHTAGIIPSVHMSKQYGRVLFYDFAGDPEYYSSHAAIFESLSSSKKGTNIFVIVNHLHDATMETTLHYWFTFIDYQKFSNSLFILVGSHSDQSADQSASLGQFCTSMQPHVQNIKHFMLDCRDPRSNQIAQFKKQILAWVSESRKYEISSESRLLLGLLEKDFKAVTACSVQTLVSHIKQSGVWLPVQPKLLHPFLLELHEVGAVLLLGDCTKDTDHVVLNTVKLTNEVHELLFSDSALSTFKKVKNEKILNIGVIPEELLQELLPPYITAECLVHLQYCQKISHDDVRFFPSLELADSTSQFFLFFPALCSIDKSQVLWDESTLSSFTIGWLALCTSPHDYFPPRFLHVLLLRLVYGFTLSPAQLTAHASPQNSRRCTMWTKGVHWKMEEGVDCMVELVNGNKGVMILSKGSMDRAEECGRVFTKVVSCVMEAKAEFCHSAKLDFFLLDSCAEADLNDDNLFAISDVKRALESPKGKHVIISVSGRGEMELSKFQCMRNLTHWNNLFPIDFDTVYHALRRIVINLYELGRSLTAPHHILQAIEADFPYDVSRRRRELVRWWMSSSQDPPCWYHLVRALRRIDENVLAEAIQQEYGLHIQLQEKILGEDTQALKPDEEFLHSLSGVVGSRWPSLAVSLKLSEAEIEKLKRKVEPSQKELALQTLSIWASRKEATYGQLLHKLKTISLFDSSN